MSIVKIKRSGTTGAPPALAQAELAYSYLAGTEANGGDRLYVGTGTETAGEAANIEVIGGKYFTSKLDHTPGVLVANSAIITNANNKIEQILIDNLSLDGNTLSSTDTNGNIILDPNGTGNVNVNNSRILNLSDPQFAQDAVTLNYLNNTYSSNLSYAADVGSDTINLRNETLNISGNTGITTTVTDDQIDIDLDDTTVTPGTYGSTTQIPVITVDQQGRLTTVTEAAVATVLNIVGDTGSDDVNLISETLDFQGGVGVTTAVANNVVEISIGQDLGPTSNVTFQDIEATGDITVAGNFYVNGNTTFVNVDTLEIEDALIRLASNNSADAVDIGFVGSYNDGIADQYAGIFRDASDGEFYVFQSYEDSNLLDNVIDKSSNTFSLGIFNADIYRFEQSTIELTGDVSGTINFSELGGNVLSITTTVQPDSVALGTDTTGNYVQSVSVTPSTGLSLTGSGEGATVVIAGVDADTAGTKGVSTYDALNFDTTAGLVSIDTVDGGTY